VFKLLVGLQGFCSPASEGDHQAYGQGVLTLFLACRMCGGRQAALEALCQSGMSRKEEIMKCRLCNKKAVSDLCRDHSAAREKLQAAYPLWVKAYERIEWSDYLDNVKRNVQTGQWAKEAAELLQGG